MKSIRPLKASGLPLCRRSLSTSSALLRQPNTPDQGKKKPLNNTPSPNQHSKPQHKHQNHQNSKIDERLNARERAKPSQAHDPKTRLRQPIGNKYTGRHALFRNTVLARFQHVLAELSRSEFSIAGVGEEHLHQQGALFMNSVDDAFLLAEQNITRRDKNPLFWNLRDAFIQKDAKGLTSEIRYAFQSFLVRHRFSRGLEECQKRLLDFRFPQEWLPGTREMQRTVHVHVGPTNSGKTYNALKALENSTNGVYAGPLRLLATEVYQRLVAKGLPCALVTGEEVKRPEETDQYFTSCTVEMIPLNTRFDVAVIDEIQMIGDPDRGNAWTMALLGVQAKDVHVCGEERAVSLIQSLCASIGDKCVIHRYERLSPLHTMDKSLDNDLSKLQKGDAVVAFSRMSLHALKRSIEKYTGRRCAIIYGSLPPEVRVQQAALFNDPNNDYDFVVASDAIGMGLNLEVRRVILESVTKFDGSQNRLLSDPEVKQIGGRAGRYRTATNPGGAATENEGTKAGYVTTMEHDDLRRVQKAFTMDVPDIECAYVDPPAGVIERFASYYPPGTPLSFILMRIRTAAVLGDRFRLSLGSDSLQIADIVQDFPLPIYDKLTFCHVPARIQTEKAKDVLRALAQCVASNSTGDLLSIKEIPLEYLDIDMRDTQKHASEYLQKMESLHDAITQYVWLSYRYSGIFRDQALAFHIRSLVEERLIDLLDRLDFTDKELARKRKTSRARAQSNKLNRTVMEQNLGRVDEESSSQTDGQGSTKLEELVVASRGAAHS